MKSFAIYGTPQQSYVAVPQGWSWPAFFFTILWAINYKMWGIGFAGLAIGVAIFLGVLLSFAGAGVDPAVGSEAAGMITGPSLGILFGLIGNRLRRAKLASRGAEFLGAVQAPSADRAIAEFIGGGTATDVRDRLTADTSIAQNPNERPLDESFSVLSLVGGYFAVFVFLGDVVLDGSWILSFGFCALSVLVSVVLVAIGVRRPSAFIRRIALPLTLLVVAVANSWLQSAVAHRNAARVIQACNTYRARHGDYPDLLADLVPSFIPAVPAAKYCLHDNGFFYSRLGDGAALSWCSRPPFGREVYRFNEGRWYFYD
jgi:hypothetical protein